MSTALTGWSWQNFKTNIQWVIPVVGIMLIYLFWGDNATTSVSIHGGGLSTLLIAFVVFLLAHKFGSKLLQWIGSALIIVWAWPRIIPIIGEFGIAPGLILAITILFGVWLWKKGAGIFWWRRIVFIILLASMVGSQGGVIREGWDDFKTSTGIHLPSVQIPTSLKNFGDAIGEYFGHRANTTVAATKVGYIKVGTAMYQKAGKNFSEENIDLSIYKNENGNVKIFFTGETTKTSNGIPMEEVLVNNPITGSKLWVMSGDVIFSELSAKDLATQKTAQVKAEEQRLLEAGWSKLYVSAPDKKGFSSITTPDEIAGKKIVTFRSCLYTQTRSNGVPSKIWAPRKQMVFPVSLGETFVDVKFVGPFN